MTRFVAPVVALVLGLGAAFGVASCGDSEDAGLLPGDTASEILANLATVKKLAAEGDCSGAAVAADTVRSQVDALGPDVDPKLKQNLAEGADQLASLAQQCTVDTETTSEETVPETTFETDTSETTETTRSTPDTTVAPTTTETTPTQPTETTPVQPPPPANGGGGNGGGAGGGGGGGGASGGSGGVGPGAQLGTP